MDNIIYQVSDDRCVIDTTLFSKSGFTGPQVLKALSFKGFKPVPCDVAREAQFCAATEYQFKRQAKMNEAPDLVDCSSLTKWLFARRGITIPRRPIQQFYFAKHVVEYPNVRAGDLLFFPGARDLYMTDPSISIGHVAIATSHMTIVHASGEGLPVIEESLPDFVAKRKLIGIRRIIKEPKYVLTLEKSPKHNIESSDDVYWIILRTLREGRF